MTHYYIDTHVWLDHYEQRGTNGQQAARLFWRIIVENAIVLYSDLHIKELKHLGHSFDEIQHIFQASPSGNIRHVHLNREQGAEARRIARKRGVPLGDAIHAI